MIRVSIFFMALIFSAQLALAQHSRISMEAHPQFVWLVSANEGIDNEGLMMGINTILVFDFFFAEKYAFSTGISLDNLGGLVSYRQDIQLKASKVNYDVPAGVEIRQRYQYIGIPLGLKLKTQEIGYSTFYINPGFTPMANIRSRVEGGVIPGKSEFYEETKLFNMNYFISGGMEYNLGGSTSLIGGLGYSAGILDIASRDNYKISTRSFYLSLGILF